MLSFISKILSQHVVLLAATRISPCSALPKCCIHSHSGLSLLLLIVLVATRISPCFALSKCYIHSHSGLSTLLHIGLSQHAFLRAPHSRNAAYIRIPGYRPTCSCMFVLLIARALCLQAVTCPAIAELLRQVVPGGCVSSILTHAEVQMVAGGTSGGAYRRNGLPSDYDITPRHIQCRCMHIDLSLIHI